MATMTAEPYRAYKPRPFTRAERDSVTIVFGGLHWRLERDLDATKPAGWMKIRVETIAHYLGRHAPMIIARKRAAMPPGCPLLAPAAA